MPEILTRFTVLDMNFWEALNTALNETIEVFSTHEVKYHLFALQKLAKNESVSWSNEDLLLDILQPMWVVSP